MAVKQGKEGVFKSMLDHVNLNRNNGKKSSNTFTPPLSQITAFAQNAISDPPAQQTGVTDHRDFDESPFWRRIPAYKSVSRNEFLDFRFQLRRSVTNFQDLKEVIGGLVSELFLDDVRLGLEISPMSMRISPYILGLINWDDPYNDPLRIQYVPVASARVADHPRLCLDSLREKKDSPVPGLVHRYPDKALFLPVEKCPVYCRFCTRSYAVGNNTKEVTKDKHGCGKDEWRSVFDYLAAHPEIEDVVVSGGDTYYLKPADLRLIGQVLLGIPHIRRLRFASRGLAVMPMKILSDSEWTNAMVDIVQEGRLACKEVCFHTHFNCQNTITDITREAIDLLYKRGVRVRNQSVLIRGVNDDPVRMTGLIKQLSYMNVQPYYVYQHDMVAGMEELRTTVAAALEIERHVRGATAGFNTPIFVNDVPGGGGKRDIYSFDYYNQTTGISVYRSPNVDGGKAYLYFDPIHLLPEEGRLRWSDGAQHNQMIAEAIKDAGMNIS